MSCEPQLPLRPVYLYQNPVLCTSAITVPCASQPSFHPIYLYPNSDQCTSTLARPVYLCPYPTRPVNICMYICLRPSWEQKFRRCVGTRVKRRVWEVGARRTGGVNRHTCGVVGAFTSYAECGEGTCKQYGVHYRYY